MAKTPHPVVKGYPKSASDDPNRVKVIEMTGTIWNEDPVRFCVVFRRKENEIAAC